MERTPIILRGQADLPTAAVGGVFGLNDSLMLMNTDRAPMVVESLRFRFTSPPNRLTWGTVRIKLGNYDITNGFVPIQAFSKLLDYSTEALLSRYAHVWPFPKPLLLMPQERISVSVYWKHGAPNTFQVHAVGYAGSTIQRLPTVREVPYCSAFLGASRLDDSGLFAEQSNEYDLGNPHASPMFVEALTGRLLSGTNATALWDQGDYVDTTWRKITVRMEDSQGNAIQKVPVPFCNAFDQLRRRWSIKTWLPPKAFFIARVEGDLNSTQATHNYFVPLIGIVGTRQERI
jgi:hypothetical protein